VHRAAFPSGTGRAAEAGPALLFSVELSVQSARPSSAT
jgi:hypothetical protein